MFFSKDCYGKQLPSGKKSGQILERTSGIKLFMDDLNVLKGPHHITMIVKNFKIIDIDATSKNKRDIYNF